MHDEKLTTIDAGFDRSARDASIQKLTASDKSMLTIGLFPNPGHALGEAQVQRGHRVAESGCRPENDAP
jgi:hypothetical protein